MYQNHNDYTFCILMALPYAYMWIRLAKSRFIKLLMLIFVAACMLGTVLSLSRGGIVGLVLMLALLYWRSTTGARRMVGIVALLSVGSVGIVWQFAAREENQKGHYTAEDAKTTRYELWRAARKIVEAHPILGVGSGRFSEKARDYAELSHNNIGKVSHNTYLEVLTGSGLLGFISFMAMLLGILRVSTEKLGARFSGIPPPLRAATQICIFTIMLRALLDAKTYDWSFYFLAVMAILIATTRGTETSATAVEEVAQPRNVPARRRLAAPLAARPAVYGRRT
jgi:putative inorganic carbon (hco3(-)) transporter